MFFPPSFMVLHIAVSKCRVYDVQCTSWLCIGNLSCYPPWWWSALRNISQGWVFCTRLVSLLREKCRKYFKVPTTRTANSLLPNAGFEGLVAEMLLGHTRCHLPDPHVAQLQQVCCILRSSLSLTWPVGLAPEAVVWDSSSELLDGAGMKPKLEMLKRLLSSLVGSQQGMKAEEDLLLLAFILKTRFCVRRERLQRKAWRGTPLCFYISRSRSHGLCPYRCAAVGVGWTQDQIGWPSTRPSLGTNVGQPSGYSWGKAQVSVSFERSLRWPLLPYPEAWQCLWPPAAPSAPTAVTGRTPRKAAQRQPCLLQRQFRGNLPSGHMEAACSGGYRNKGGLEPGVA